MIALLLVGAVTQAGLEWRDRRAHPTPGDLVDVGDGRQIHLQVVGEEHDGPTVVLEAGAGWYSSWWGWVQPAVAEHATVASYDRAGLGWSGPPDEPFTTEGAVADLRSALDARGVEGPYVLIGYSLGGLLVRAFADSHPDNVVGLVLVDPSHEDALERVEGFEAELNQWLRVLRAVQAAARFGALRVHYPVLGDAIADLPEAQQASLRAQTATPAYLAASIADNRALWEASAYARGIADLGDTPVRVLSAGDDTDVWRALRADLAGLSTDGAHRVVERRRPLHHPHPAAARRRGHRRDRRPPRHGRDLAVTAA